MLTPALFREAKEVDPEDDNEDDAWVAAHRMLDQMDEDLEEYMEVTRDVKAGSTSDDSLDRQRKELPDDIERRWGGA